MMNRTGRALRFSALMAVLLAQLAMAQLAIAQAQRTPVLMVSIDGFRNDYLDRTELYDAPNLRALAAEGVRAEALIPVFPTKTFPNHYTIATGLYPAHSGIVGNRMYDPETHEIFSVTDRKAMQDPRWWQGEPIWVTAEKQGCATAPVFWPGSEAAIEGVRPTHWAAYDESVPNAARVARALGYLAEAKPPCYLSIYFSDVDTAGHHTGPESKETRAAVHAVDANIGELIAGLKQQGLWGKINLIIVSDHGMAATPASQRIALDGYIDPAAVEVIDGSPVFELSAKDGNHAALVASLNRVPHLHAYLAKDLPERWHFSGSRRIAPVVAVAEEGWTFDTREHMLQWKDPHLGNHGFDNDLASMRAIFIAVGPGFQSGGRLPAFENIHIYSLLAELLHLKPAPNDGNLAVFLPVLRSAAAAEAKASPIDAGALELGPEAPFWK
jgi:predicted AlkP superfamily pyrophosphatase or phosphodiesterase